MDKDQTIEAISRKLDIICSLMLREKMDSISPKEQFNCLSQFSLSDQDMARLLGKTPNAIYILRSRNRKKGG